MGWVYEHWIGFLKPHKDDSRIAGNNLEANFLSRMWFQRGKETQGSYFGSQKKSKQKSLILINLKSRRILKTQRIRRHNKTSLHLPRWIHLKGVPLLPNFFKVKLKKVCWLTWSFLSSPNIPAAVITNILSLDFNKYLLYLIFIKPAWDS